MTKPHVSRLLQCSRVNYLVSVFDSNNHETIFSNTFYQIVLALRGRKSQNKIYLINKWIIEDNTHTALLIC